MSKHSYLLLALALSVQSGCQRERTLEFVEFPRSTDVQPIGEPPIETSFVAVLADPVAFDGKHVRIQGVINLEFEGDQVCLDRGSLQYLATKNCLWVSLAPGEIADSYQEIAKWNGHYALLEGDISSDHHGHMGLFRAAITKVSRILLVKPPGRVLPPE